MTTVENAQSTFASALDKDRLVASLLRPLQQTLFTNSLRFSPRRTSEVAQEMADSFLQFRETENERAVILYGQNLARDGMSPHTILSMAEALRTLCLQSSSPTTTLVSVAGRYANALLEGYIAAREAFVLQQQDHIRRAFERAFERTRS